MRKMYLLPAALRHSLLLLLCLTAAFTSEAQRVKRVLFIGNSFIGANDLPSIVREMADRAGFMLEYETYTPGGATVKYIPHGARSHANNPAVYALIRSRPWDYIVVQDNQGFFCLPTIGDYGRNNLTEEGHMQLRDSLLKVNSCGRLVLFSGWVDKDPYAWEPSLGLYTAAEANQKVYLQYKYLNDRYLQQVVSPIGIAWNRVMAEIPGLELFAGDNYHPTYEGSYVTAATLFATIFNASAEDVLFDGFLPPAQARIVRRLAYETVLDSVGPTGLGKRTPELKWAGTTLHAVGSYMSYEWFENGLPAPVGTAPTILGREGACYQLKARDYEGCEVWSMKTCFTPTAGLPEAGVGQDAVRIWPNPCTGLLNLAYQGWRSIRVSDLSGRVLLQSSGNSGLLDISALAAGAYLLSLTDEAGNAQVVQVWRQ